MLCGKSHYHIDNNTFFINEKGEFHRLAVPFHLALTSRIRQDQHDHLLLKHLDKTEIGSDDWFQNFSDLKMVTSRKTVFQNALHKLSTAEEAHQFIARIRSIPTSSSLGDLPNIAEKSVTFYARIIGESKPAIGEYEKKSKFEMDSIVVRIVQCHMNRFGERTEMSDRVLKVGDWLKHLDLTEGDVDVYSE